MKPSRIFALTALAFAALPATAGQSNAESTATKADEVDPNIAEAIRRGKMLYDFDQAAWHSTDALAAKAGDLAKLKLVGRVVVPVEGGLETLYYGRNATGRYTIFSGVWNGTEILNPVYLNDDAGPPLSSEANAYADIIELLMAGKLETKDLWYCNKARPNFALLPGDETGTYLLYFMTAQQKNDTYPLGGHHLLTIRDGKVVTQRKFTNSCIDMGGSANADENLSLFYLTHSLDDTPTEIHVFTAIASRTNVMVGTTGNKQTWIVTPKGNSASIVNEKNVKD